MSAALFSWQYNAYRNVQIGTKCLFSHPQWYILEHRYMQWDISIGVENQAIMSVGALLAMG
jgi:hypothetical protein